MDPGAASREEGADQYPASIIVELVHLGKLEGMFHKLRRRPPYVECWIKRTSLDAWVAARDAESAQYMSRPEARRTLGLHGLTILRIAEAGLIRYVHGSEHYFGPGFYFLREDISKIKHAFERHIVPMRDYSKPGKLIALGHALVNLGRDSGLPVAMRAVVEGTLKPVAYTNRFPGIMGYLFWSDQLRTCRSPRSIQIPPDGFLNYSEAALLLHCSAGVIAGLVAQGALGAFAGCQSGRSKLVPAREIYRFSAEYIGVKALAQRLRVKADWLRTHLKKSGTPLFTVHLGAGRRALFLLKEVASEVRISPGGGANQNGYNGCHRR